MLSILFAFVSSFAIAFVAIPSIIKIAEIKHLFDYPDNRKLHRSTTPTLGGIAIFAGMIFSLTFWSTQSDIVELQFILSAVILIFFMGIKDDLFNLVAWKKLLGQFAASFLLVHFAGIKITTFYGLFGVNDLSLYPSYIISIFTIIVITNSLNLIDGIDGLAGAVGTIGSCAFGWWFFQAGVTQYAILASCLGGALLGFLYYNFSPAKIFMGDTGSLIVGLVLSILAIKFIEMNRILDRDHPHKVLSVPVVTLAILVIPLFDTLRVFAIRVLQGRSPFSADRNHIHHLFLDLGVSHRKTTGILVSFNVFAVLMIYSLQNVRGEILLASLLSTCLLFSSLVAARVRQKTLGRVSNSFAASSSQLEDEDSHLQ